MASDPFEYLHLRDMLRRRLDDPALVELLLNQHDPLGRNAHYGFVEFRGAGVSLALKEAPWVLLRVLPSDAPALVVSGIHFHREGHEGHGGYSGQLLNGLRLNDGYGDVIRKLGKPETEGGGNVSKFLGVIPKWSRYADTENISIQIQWDAGSRVELISLFVPDVPLQS